MCHQCATLGLFRWFCAQVLGAVHRVLRAYASQASWAIGVAFDARPPELQNTIGMFGPMGEAMQMLKCHPLTEKEQEILELLDELRKPAPEQWNAVYIHSMQHCLHSH